MISALDTPYSSDFVQTGTLTEGDLDLAGVCEIKANQFQVNCLFTGRVNVF